MNALPPSIAPAQEAQAQAQAIVLRDVVMQGQVALTRPRMRASAASPLAGHAQAQAVAAPPLPQAQNDRRTHVPAQPQPEPAQAADEARRRGYEEGFAQGCIEGRARGDEEARQAAEKAARELEERAERTARELKQQAQAAYQARVQVLDGLIAALPAQFDARLAAAEDDMLALCFEVVCRTLGESVVRPEALRAQLAQTLGRLHGRQPAAIHMHPDDLALLRKAQDAAQELPGGNAVQWIADPKVLLGGCIVQTPEGGLDARFETQLDALRELLLQTRAAARGQGG